MPQFTRTGVTNLIRHRSGVYYLQAKVGGVKVRRSLKTKSKDLARHILQREIQRLRAVHGKSVGIGEGRAETVREYLEQWRRSQNARRDIEETTKGYYLEISGWLERRFPNDASPREFKDDLWQEVVKQYAPTQANNILSMLRAIGDSMVENGHLDSNPFASIKRRKARAAMVDPLSLEQIEKVIDSIRGQGKAFSDEAADFVGVLAFSGLRVGQVRALKAQDVGAKSLIVREGVTGSKGAAARVIPMNRLLEPLLRRRVAAGFDSLFVMLTPRNALNNATKRLGYPKQRVHDLRHFFATYCIEQGVDIPTVSRWLGHKDGGMLAMRTYGHLRDEHSHAMAKLI